MQTRKSKAGQTVEGICIILSNISKGTAFLHLGVTNCGFRKIVPYNLIRRVCNMMWYRCSENERIFCRSRMKFENDTIEIKIIE